LNRRRALCVLCSALSALLAGCTAKHPAPVKPKADTHAVAPAKIASVARSAPSALVPLAPSTPNCGTAHAAALGAESVTQLVNRWRAAQKTANLSAYSALYAEHFSGLSAGPDGVGRLDRTAWFRVHERSLALDPRLLTASVRVAIGAGGARVTFEPRDMRVSQRLPELFVISTTDGPKIAREAPMRPAPNELADHPGSWLANERFATLSTKPEASWAEGAPSFSGDYSATSAVALDRLPKALRAWLGHPVRVLSESGIVCETRLQRFAIRAQISPDLATAEVWDGCSGEHAQTPAQIAQDIWQLSAPEGRTLVAELSAPCKGALVAVDPDLPAPLIAAPEPASAELGAAALAQFRELPAYTRLQARFKASAPNSDGAWEDRTSRRSVWSLDLAGHRPLVFVSVEAGRGCADFSGSLSALWEVRGNGAGATLDLLAVPSAEDDKRLTPRAVIAFGATLTSVLLGPDGAYQIQSLLTGGAEGYGQTLLTSVPFFAGPC
jgi:hypothetical protein